MWKIRKRCSPGSGHEVKKKKRSMQRFRNYGIWVFTPSVLLLVMGHFLFWYIYVYSLRLFYLMVIACNDYKILLPWTQISKTKFRIALKQKTPLSETETVTRKTSRIMHRRAL